MFPSVFNTFNFVLVYVYPSVLSSTLASSARAPATPQQQESAGIHGEDEQINAKQELVHFVTESKPIFLSHAFILILLEGKFKDGKLFQDFLQLWWTGLGFCQRQQVRLRREIKLVAWMKETYANCLSMIGRKTKQKFVY